MTTNDTLDYFEVFPWNKNFDTGHPEIDKQHKKLVLLLNNLANTLTRNKPIEVNEAFQELASYADYHFEAEELIWAEYFKDDNWFQSHQLSHSSFLPKVIELKENQSNKPLEDVIESIVKFLIRWLAFHIIDDDKRLALVVNAMENGEDLAQAKAISDRKMNGSIRILIETVLTMYDGLSSRTLNLMRERNARIKAEEQLNQAYEELKHLNTKLEKQSITDDLTKLFNRRHFETMCKQEIKRARRDKRYLSLILFDIDFFKRLNDRYGHPQGDKVLKSIGSSLIHLCKRPTDFAFRVGGEEFAVLISNDIAGSGFNFAKLIRQNIEELNIPNEDSSVKGIVTISAGVHEIIPSSCDTVSILMKAADKKLYHAKNSGRNTIVQNLDAEDC